MRTHETAAFQKAREREKKQILLETKHAFQTALSLVDGLLQQSYHGIDLDETFFEPAEVERELVAGRSSMPVIDPKPQPNPNKTLFERPAEVERELVAGRSFMPVIDPKPQPNPNKTLFERAEVEMELAAGLSLNETLMPVIKRKPQPNPKRTLFKPAEVEMELAAVRSVNKTCQPNQNNAQPKITWLSKPKSRPSNLKPAFVTSTPEKRRFEIEDGHICELPRCWKHQPFRATAREVKFMSDEEKAMWNFCDHPLTPQGYWDI